MLTNCGIFLRINLLKISCRERREWYFREPKFKNVLGEHSGFGSAQQLFFPACVHLQILMLRPWFPVQKLLCNLQWIQFDSLDKYICYSKGPNVKAIPQFIYLENLFPFPVFRQQAESIPYRCSHKSTPKYP